MPDINTHYVKFIRGSIEAWELLNQTPNRIDDDTLYFIYASVENPREGKLYLGQKLISGVGSDGIININDIGDVYINDSTLADRQILIYNDTTQRWENTSLSMIIENPIGEMSGATENTNGSSGLVPAPSAGDQDKFLSGDGTWKLIAVPSFNDDVFSVVNNEVTLNGFGLAPVGSLPIKTSNGIEWSTATPGTLNKRVTTLEKLQAQISGEDDEPLDANAIYMVANGNSPDSTNCYDEYIIVGGHLELLGTFGTVDLVNYVTIPTFHTAISSLEEILNDTFDEDTGKTNLGLISRVDLIEQTYITRQEIGDLNSLILSEGNTTLVEEVNTISDRLKWHELENN